MCEVTIYLIDGYCLHISLNERIMYNYLTLLAEKTMCHVIRLQRQKHVPLLYILRSLESVR